MTATIRHWLVCALLFLLGAAVTGQRAEAQQIFFDPMNAQTFQMPADSGKFITVHDTDTLRQLGVNVGVGLNYSKNLLVVRENREIKRSVLKELMTTDLMIAFGLVDILQMDLTFPFHAYVKAGFVEREDTFTTNYPGDLRVGAKVKFLDRVEYPVGLGLRGYLNAPNGKHERYLGDEKVGGGVKILADVELEHIFFGLNLGYHIRDAARTPDQVIDDQLTYAVATNLQLTNHFELVFDVNGSTVAKEAFKGTFGNPVEGSAGLKFFMDSGYGFSMGAGRGFTSGFGAAPYRLHASLTWKSPQDRDRDRDGVIDEKDLCPGQMEDQDGFVDWDGCPDLDHDEDRINDDKDVCTDVPEDHDGYQDDDGCPEFDNDGDGILDEIDDCPLQAETPNNYLDKDGCPDVAEIIFRSKVVDEQTGARLSGIVKIEPQVGEMQFDNGRFEHTFVEPKVYEFQFTSPGYLPETRKFSLGGGQNFDVRIKLKRDTRGVEEMKEEVRGLEPNPEPAVPLPAPIAPAAPEPAAPAPEQPQEPAPDAGAGQ